MIPRLNIIAGLAALTIASGLAAASPAVAAPLTVLSGKAAPIQASEAGDIVLVHDRGYYEKKRSRHYHRYHRRDHWRHREAVDAPFTRYRRYHRDVEVDAPFVSVRRRHHGVHVRAPFVDLYVPRWR